MTKKIIIITKESYEELRKEFDRFFMASTNCYLEEFELRKASWEMEKVFKVGADNYIKNILDKKCLLVEIKQRKGYKTLGVKLDNNIEITFISIE